MTTAIPAPGKRIKIVNDQDTRSKTLAIIARILATQPVESTARELQAVLDDLTSKEAKP